MTRNTRESIIAAWLVVAGAYIAVIVVVAVVYHVMGWV